MWQGYPATGKTGAWTDVYGICAAMYYSLTGFIPNDSVLRLQKDDLPNLSTHFATPSWMTGVIMKGLNLHPADRYQTMEELYQAFVIPPVEINSEMKQKLTAVKYNKTVMPTADGLHSRIILLRIGLAGIAVLLIYAVLGFCGASLPLWSDNWTYASISDSLEDENEATTDNSSDLTKTDTKASNIGNAKPEEKSTTVKNAESKASDTNNTNNTTTQSTSTQNNNVMNSTSTQNNNTTNENSTSTQKNSNTTEKNTSTQGKDIFISLPDNEYDTFTDKYPEY